MTETKQPLRNVRIWEISAASGVELKHMYCMLDTPTFPSAHQWLHATNCQKQRDVIIIRPNRHSESSCDSNLIQDFRSVGKEPSPVSSKKKKKEKKKRDLFGGSNSLCDIFSQTFDCEAEDSSSGASCSPPQRCGANGSSRALNRISGRRVSVGAQLRRVGAARP